MSARGRITVICLLSAALVAAFAPTALADARGGRSGGHAPYVYDSGVAPCLMEGHKGAANHQLMKAVKPTPRDALAVRLLTREGNTAPAGVSGQSPIGRTRATMVSATSVRVPIAPLPPCLQPCYVQQPCPCGNVAPWSWQHDNQNDDQWPADHGG